MADKKLPSVQAILDKEQVYKDYAIRIDALAAGDKGYSTSFPNRKIVYGNNPEISLTNVQFGEYLVKLRKEGKTEEIRHFFETEWGSFQGRLAAKTKTLNDIIETYGKEIVEQISIRTGIDWDVDFISVYPTLSFNVSRHKDKEIFICLDYETKEMLIPELTHELMHANTDSIKNSLKLEFVYGSVEIAHDFLTEQILENLGENESIKLKYQFNERLIAPLREKGYFDKVRLMCRNSNDYGKLVKEIDKFIGDNF
jgi:hypothetical protein